MKHSLAAEDLNIETSTVPHAHGEDEQQEDIAPKRTGVEHIHRGKLCQDGVEELSTNERGLPVLLWKFGQDRSNDTPLGI